MKYVLLLWLTFDGGGVASFRLDDFPSASSCAAAATSVRRALSERIDGPFVADDYPIVNARCVPIPLPTLNIDASVLP